MPTAPFFFSGIVEASIRKNISFSDGESEQTVEVKGKEVVLNRLRVGNRVTKGTKR